MRVAFRSDRGRKRINNEDSVCVDVDSGIFILADGMGGHQAGEVASEIAVRKVHQLVKEKISGSHESPNYRKCLLESFAGTNDALRQAALVDKSLHGMGTTLLVAAVGNGKVNICHVGDSRAYVIRESIRQLTKDQAAGGFLVEYDSWTCEDIDPGPWRVLTQAVGTSEHLTPEFLEMSVQKDDFLLLCSDGLTDMLSDDEISSIFAQCGRDVECLADCLVDAANDNGGHDNISVIVVKFE